MFKKRFFLALALTALTGLSFGNTVAAKSTATSASHAMPATNATTWFSIFDAVTPSDFWGFTTAFATCGTESFNNIPSTGNTSQYTTRTWTGDNGVAWSSTDSRTDQVLTGKAIAIRTGALTNTSSVSGGIGTLSFSYARVFTGNSTLKVFVNGVQYGGNITVSLTTATTFTQAINVAGPVTIRIENSGGSSSRTVIDSLTWDCFAVAGPEIQLVDSSSVNHDCGDMTIDYGSHPVSVYADAIFTVKNLGTSTLTVSALNLSNTTDFAIISPATPFNVAPSASSIVLVRFLSVTAGNATSTLTIVSNDANEANCEIDLTGTAVNPCTVPAVVDADVEVSNVNFSSADVAVNNVAADGYLAVVTTSAPLTDTPDNTVSYPVGSSIGGGVVAYNGDSSTFTITGLDDDADYTIYVFPYNNADCSGGPLYNTEDALDTIFSTPVAPCIGGNETFNNMPASNSAYAVRSWTGDGSIGWTANDARTDLTLNGRAIGIRTGTLTNTTAIASGVGTLSFNYARVFTGNSTLKVFVNGVQYGGDIAVSLDTPTLFSTPVNVAGPATIEIENSGERTIIDDLTWTCYEMPEGPEIQLADENLVQKACGDFEIDFDGVALDSFKEITFVIENIGTEPLVIDSLYVSDEVNYEIVSPSAPVSIDPLESQDVVVRFTAIAAGNYPAVITIESNDVDESSCTVDLNASAQPLCTTPDASEGALDISNMTSSSADVEVSNIAADGYIAIISPTAFTPTLTDGTIYTVGDNIGLGVVAYVGDDTLFTLNGLDADQTYFIYVFAFNNADCANGPLYSSFIDESFETASAPCIGGTETFTNMPASNSAYAIRSWTGDGSIGWTANDARTDLTMNLRAIGLRNSTLTNTTTITGGIGTLTFNYARVFTGNSTLKVFVNGTQYGGDITVSLDTPTVFSQAINVSGPATIQIVNSGQRILVDDVSWTCFSGMARKTAGMETGNTMESLNSDVKLYPNPSNGQFQLELANGADNADVMVYDALGKQVLSKKVTAKEMIDLGSATKGIYMVVITSGGNTSTKKVVIK